ncbi:LacI family DNA-binding transcriptional regulator [Streptococcus equi subsp. equi]|nr:LacI family DNA-binding transcriptional regulator [Streptococcus equi subsp. equi]
MKDVAREAGVSVATVSYVINNREDQKISPETRNKVLQMINLLNYRPNQAAKSLVTQKDS